MIANNLTPLDHTRRLYTKRTSIAFQVCIRAQRCLQSNVSLNKVASREPPSRTFTLCGGPGSQRQEKLTAKNQINFRRQPLQNTASKASPAIPRSCHTATLLRRTFLPCKVQPTTQNVHSTSDVGNTRVL